MPATRVAPIWYHPGRPEPRLQRGAKACVRPARSGWKASSGTMTWAPVLSESSIVAGSTMPAPSSPLGASPVPVTTGVPGARPSASAASGVISPATALEGFTGGSRMLGISTASSRSGDQLRQRASKSNEAEPSPGSVAVTPVIRRRISSLARATASSATRSRPAPRRIQAAVAAMKPVTSGLPAISISRSAPIFAVTSDAWRDDRWSAQMTAERAPVRSRRETPRRASGRRSPPRRSRRLYPTTRQPAAPRCGSLPTTRPGLAPPSRVAAAGPGTPRSRAKHGTVQIDHQGFDGGCAEIDAEKCLAHGVTRLIRRLGRRRPSAAGR